MQNDRANPHLHSRLHMPTRMPSQPSTFGRGRPSSSRSPSPRPTPLTPCNTFNDGFESSDPLVVALDPECLECSVPDTGDQLLDHVVPIDAGHQDDIEFFDSTIKKRSVGVSNCSNHDLNEWKPTQHSTIISTPSSPLSNAAVASSHATPGFEADSHRKKRAHFDDNIAVLSDVLVRRNTTMPCYQRRKSAPGRVSSSAEILERRSSPFNAEEDGADNEPDAAIGIFNEAVQELVQTEQEDTEEVEEASEVARAAAVAIRESEEAEYEVDHGDLSPRSSQTSQHRMDELSNDCFNSSHIRQSSADEDVDETCLEPCGISFDDFAEELSQRHSGQFLNYGYCQPGTLQYQEAVLPPILEDAAPEHSNSSAETVISPRSPNRKLVSGRRASEPYVQDEYVSGSHAARRYSSMEDFSKVHGHLLPLNLPAKLTSKTSPASCAVTACSVSIAESPKLNTVYEHPAASIRQASSDKAATITAHTVRSDSGIFQVLWEEPPSSSNSCVTLFDNTDLVSGSPIDESQTITSAHARFPMHKVKTKLAAWSWAREQSLVDEDGNPKWIPLLSFETPDSQQPSASHSPGGEWPLGPPNTERPSGASSVKHSCISSGKQSAAGSPPGEREIAAEDEDEDDEGNQPLELRVKAALSLPPKTKAKERVSDYLDVPDTQSHSISPSADSPRHAKVVTRQLSNLAAEDEHFKTHRDSLILLRNKEREEEIMNQHLMNSQDSMILTRYKFESRYPSSSKLGRSHIRELSPIPDASPPDSRVRLRDHRSGGTSNCAKQDHTKAREDDRHPDEHVNCPIYEVERPQWVRANVKKGVFM